MLLCNNSPLPYYRKGWLAARNGRPWETLPKPLGMWNYYDMQCGYEAFFFRRYRR